MTEYQVVLCTCPDESAGKALAAHLLQQGLAACINLIPGVLSMYQWDGKLCEERECQLVIKTRAEQQPALEAAICQHHPYDVPEIIALPIQWGHQAYLDWIKQHCAL
ncbi:divalent-cation tolerance protein CutA [Ferrimonas pelagia]|uniref:Divalent-cation tolerance protein CutA n=1 Tax=Ferrimonas pelagia TaxID=1177826 RepID=A0ABP9EBD0_9GAMM